ncbi:hypothetical protein LK540_18740 [Massilia sp. IC2-278]|uniref:hypothetical protein n=1 Tax=Massilia sp. IC2-278 TaxID=2887200 RepID=UPI001E5ADD17|nr:hypothetical protein [Massilia sp. IC2-278]MCC2962469.1 hypothetical protein [Massilia sp. IC2-278]
MHIERIDFDDVFDVQPGPGDFSFRSRGQTHYAVNLWRGLIPQAGSSYLVAFAQAGDWSTVLGWLDLQTGTRRLKDNTWLAVLSDMSAIPWLAPFLLGGALLFIGPGAALAVLLALCGVAGVHVYRIVRRRQRVLRALSMAYLDAGARRPGVAGSAAAP